MVSIQMENRTFCEPALKNGESQDFTDIVYPCLVTQISSILALTPILLYRQIFYLTFIHQKQFLQPLLISQVLIHHNQLARLIAPDNNPIIIIKSTFISNSNIYYLSLFPFIFIFLLLQSTNVYNFNNSLMPKFKNYLTSITPLLALLSLVTLLPPCMSTSITVTSASPVVGQSTNYSITISNHSSPSRILTQFSAWAPGQAAPYASNYQYYLNSGSFSGVLLSCRLRFSGAVIECSLPAPLGQTLQLIITRISNPSSTKPYPITFTLVTSSGTQQTITTQLSVPSIRTSDITLLNHNNTVGMSSTTIWALSFDFYFTSSTVLLIQYPNSHVSISYAGLNDVNVSQTVVNDTRRVVMSGWSDTARGVRLLSGIVVSNPQAAIGVVLTGLLYFVEGNVTYNVQAYALGMTIVPARFNTIVGSTTLILGQSNQVFTITSAICAYSAVNKDASNTSTYTLSYPTTALTASSCSNSTSTPSLKSCRYSSPPLTIASLTHSITPSTTTITISLSTYFAPLTSYYPLCQQSYTITLTPQILPLSSITFNTVQCGSGRTGDMNSNTVLVVKGEGLAVGDVVGVEGMLGEIGDGGWVRTPGTNSYRYTLGISNIINSTHITLPLPYPNPSIMTTTYITNLTLTRNTTLYAYITSSIPLCPVIAPSTLPSIELTISSILTYQNQVIYTFNINNGNKIRDYVVGDYARVGLVGYDGVLFLAGLALEAKLIVNGVSSVCEVQVINNTLLHIFNISRINNNNSTAILSISNMLNPATQYPIATTNSTGYSINISLISASLSTAKQSSLLLFSTPSTATQYSYTPRTVTLTNSPSLNILTLMPAITLTLSNVLKGQYFTAMPNTNIELRLPFVCNESDAMGVIVREWPGFSGSLSVGLTGCRLGYLNASAAGVRLREWVAVGNGTVVSTYTEARLGLACPDNCYACSSTSTCSQCVNSTHSAMNYLFMNQCVAQCPVRTYNTTNSQCLSCHASCLTCSGPSLAQCLTCPAFFFTKQVNITSGSASTLTNICASVCGQNQYRVPATGTCAACEIDCQHCLTDNYCYVCKQGASQVGVGVCDFTLCTAPCSKCQGSVTNCTVCIDQLSLYDNKCYDSCPNGTYKDSQIYNSVIISICLQVSTPTLYFPACICSIVLIGLVFVCNGCIERGMTDTTRRNINMLTYSSSILAFMELFAMLILVIFTVNTNSRALAVAGAAVWALCNVLFGVYYCRVIRPDEAIERVVEGMSPRSKCVYYATVVCSVGVTLRTYRVLYCGLFRGVAPYSLKKKIEQPRAILEAKKQTKIANLDTQPPKPTQISHKTLPKPSPAPIMPTPEADQLSSAASTPEHTQFQLKRPQIIYITIGSLFGSILFLVSAIIDIITNLYPGMLFWGLDLLIVVIVSVVVTCLDMWAGVKKSYLMALERDGVNDTMENLRQEEYDEYTQQKMLSNVKTTQKIGKRSPNKFGNDKAKPPMPKKKYVPPPGLFGKGRSPGSPKSPAKVLSPQQKQALQKSNQLKKIKSRYSNLPKRKSKPTESPPSSITNQIPEIKIFEDIQPPTEHPSTLSHHKAKKLRSTQNRLASNSHLRRTFNQTYNPVNNLTFSSGGSVGRMRGGWKVDDIFLGFREDEMDEEGFDGKTVKLGQKEREREIYSIEDQKEAKVSESESDGVDIDSEEGEKQQGKEDKGNDQVNKVNSHEKKAQELQKQNPI